MSDLEGFERFLAKRLQTTSDFRNPRLLCRKVRSDCRNLHFHRPCCSPFFWNPVPLIQNYMIKSVKMTKKSILRDQFSWKVRTFADAFRKGCRFFCCSTFRERTATSNKEINEQTYYRRSMRSIAQTTPLGNRGCRRPVHGNGTGSALSLCPYR